MKNEIEALKSWVENYKSIDSNDQEAKMKVLAFLDGSKTPFGKADSSGHITGSALVLNKQATKVLLTHHLKLNKWLQFGGHTEIGERVEMGALRETQEESGLKNLTFVSEDIFDIDVHYIPTYKGIPGHYHYDIRFLIEADELEAYTLSKESHDIKWIPLEDVCKYTNEASMLRMVAKVKSMV